MSRVVSALRPDVVARRVGVVVAFLFTTVALSLALGGCRMEGLPSADLAVGTRGGFLAVVNCGAPMVGPIRVYVGEQRAEGFEDFFVADRGDSWGTGVTVTTNPAEWGEVRTASQPLLEPRMSFSVSPLAESGGAVAYFVVPESGMPKDAWLHPSGTVSHEPCAAAE